MMIILGSDFMSYKKIGLRGKILSHTPTKIHENCDFEGYFSKAAKFKQSGLGTQLFCQIAGNGPYFYAPYAFYQLGLTHFFLHLSDFIHPLPLP